MKYNKKRARDDIMDAVSDSDEEDYKRSRKTHITEEVIGAIGEEDFKS